MVDKLDLAIPAAAGFRPAFGKMIEELRNTKNSPIRTSSQHYSWTADLRPYGHDAILHMGNKHAKAGDHKLELIDTAEKSAGQLNHHAHEIFELSKEHADLRIMRIDLAADIPSVPVTWFKERVKVEFKRRHREEGKEEFQYVEDGKKRVQTLYYGQKPNQIRIYDKHDEKLFQYEKLKRGYVRDLKNRAISAWLQEHGIPEADVDFPALIRKRVRDLIRSGKQFPSFEDVFQSPEKGVTLTRFERQIGGGRFPDKIRTISDLKNLPDYNPFSVIHVMCRDYRRPDPQIYDRHGKCRRLQTHCTGLFLKRMAEEYGMQRVVDFMNQFPSRQAMKKWRTTYADYLPASPEREFHGYDERTGITSAQLYDFYRDSVQRQLAA
jgi:hypothetical protein